MVQRRMKTAKFIAQTNKPNVKVSDIMTTVRNLVVGCDGTWNDAGSGSATNVVKILNACAAKNQELHYEEGVGTAHWEALPGGIYGKGLDRQILGAYRFLRRRFTDSDWDRNSNRIFIFGFSRGSYAARRLSGLIAHCGIPVKPADIELAWQLYLKRDKKSIEALKKKDRLFEFPIEMLGVWDTVKTTTDEDYDDNKLPACVVTGYHAMAIDEARKFFPVLKWNKDTRVQQLWFAGVHSDIGGGYSESGLSDIALQWMVDSACSHGLKFKVAAINKLKRNPRGTLHNSYDGIWEAFGKRTRVIADSALIHESVKQRIQSIPDYKPKNLPHNPNYRA